MSAPDMNVLSFDIFSTCNIKDLVILNVLEVIVLVDEELEPARVGVPHLHIVGSSGILDVE